MPWFQASSYSVSPPSCVCLFYWLSLAVVECLFFLKLFSIRYINTVGFFMLMWNEKILTTIPRDHPLSGERSFTLHWKKHFTELFTPSLAFDVKENAIASLLWITDTSFIIIWCSGGKPASWGRYGLFSSFDLSFKEGDFQGDFFAKSQSTLFSFKKFGLHSLLLQWSNTVFILNFPFYNMLWTRQLKCNLGLDEWILQPGFQNQVLIPSYSKVPVTMNGLIETGGVCCRLSNNSMGLRQCRIWAVVIKFCKY